jgi:hypothetical protein
VRGMQCHERMHRTLKEDTTNPVALTLRLQQRKFDVEALRLGPCSCCEDYGSESP